MTVTIKRKHVRRLLSGWAGVNAGLLAVVALGVALGAGNTSPDQGDPMSTMDAVLLWAWAIELVVGLIAVWVLLMSYEDTDEEVPA